MKTSTKGFLTRWREEHPRFAAIGVIGSFAATVLFALYNGGLGLWHASLWHGSICIYYVLLSLLRGVLLAAEHRSGSRPRETAEAYRKKVFRMTAGMVLVMNAALILPVFLMVLDRRPIQMGMIPAITSATYTTYKISAAAVKWKRAKGTVLSRELSMLRLVDALVSILVLQNTLVIAVDGGISQRTFRLVAISSAGLLLLVYAVSVTWFRRGMISCRNRY